MARVVLAKKRLAPLQWPLKTVPGDLAPALSVQNQPRCSAVQSGERRRYSPDRFGDKAQHQFAKGERNEKAAIMPARTELVEKAFLSCAELWKIDFPTSGRKLQTLSMSLNSSSSAHYLLWAFI